MRLKKIKLGGFKSFVDPTSIVFPSQLVGVVGPNGCGKSNVIDAVRWVMGESSAKHLRGDSLADVIFNGSSARKPVGHATIELVFDNHSGRLGGQYASYSEISVKRQLSRDGQSIYFLNGSRCRRRDITDVFLGTGLGPRSYAIIEQGTISRLIEAKPDELRVFLEEAAGISKYKERRRETENRIRDTHENLNRLNDIVVELEKRLQTLQRQAKTAERYKEIKETERLIKAQLLVLRWQGQDREAGAKQNEISQREIGLERQMAALRSVETDIEKQRDAHVEATESFNKVQGDYYHLGSEIARLEQSIQHHKERRQQYEKDLEEIERAWQEAQSHLRHDHQRIQHLNEILESGTPELEQLREIERTSFERLAAAENELGNWQTRWESFNQHLATHRQQTEVDRTRIAHLEVHQKTLNERLLRLEGEFQGLAAESFEAETQSLAAEIRALNDGIDAERQQLQTVLMQINERRQENNRLTETLEQAKEDLHLMQRRHASLEALQLAALGKQEEVVGQWLTEQGFSELHRLAEDISVDQGWESAAETVLGHYLEAVCVDGLDTVIGRIEQLARGVLTVFDTRNGYQAEGRIAAARLKDKIRAPWRLDAILGGVYAVDSLAEALALRDGLGVNESIVTRDGIWIGNGWLRVARGQDETGGVLAREQELRQLGRELEATTQRVAELDQRLQGGNEQLYAFEAQREHLQKALDEKLQHHAELRAQVSSKDASLEQIQQRRQQIRAETSEIREQMQRDDAGLVEARARLAELEGERETLEAQRASLSEERDRHRAEFEQCKQQADRDRDACREVVLRIETTRAQRESLTAGLERIEQQLAALERQRRELQEAVTASEAPISEMQAELARQLEHRLQVESRLAQARQRVEELDHLLRELSDRRNQAEQQVLDVRSELEQARMAWQEVNIRRQTLAEQIGESGFEMQTLLAEMPEDADEQAWQAEVESIAQKIQRMGPINLAAIDEYQEQSERKNYLDAQCADLNEALATLENAIRKIDNETKARFQDTFDLVNDRLQQLYPKLFGGGNAHLDMTSDDLLEAGVTVMARPPGKRNANIHQLSGGEKALTAVALVFALFELNPAPFCMLDEVDAPLDDSNAARFCQLVREMSDRVQFIFITHNKITMEMADQLIGITMHEPGVSRPVSVDVDQAVEMVAV